tara:strand:- start:15 stop:383 length:369 start_codon:yes stop_codon:yes gene_type:complete
MEKTKKYEWLTEAEQTAHDYRKDCIDTVVTDINWELMSDDYEFEEWHIGDHITAYVENACIYSYDCKEILKKLNYDVWADDPMYGERANSEMQAAIWALEGALYDSDIEGQIKNELNLKSDG